MIFLSLMFVANGLSAMATSLEQLIAFRFLSGLPHGSYFGAAIIFAADLTPKNERANCISKVFMGLTIVTIVGVPVVILFIGGFMMWVVSYVKTNKKFNNLLCNYSVLFLRIKFALSAP